MRPDERGIDRPDRRTDISYMMRRIRIERVVQRHRDDRAPVLPIEPRDTEVVRAKQVARESAEAKRP